MTINKEKYKEIINELKSLHVGLVAVSKTKPAAAIQELYNEGQRDFGENYVQELVEKSQTLPNDIRWHFIGHLQSNKVKYIATFVYLIHGVDSLNLLKEIDKQAKKINRKIPVLLQMYIAREETKFGMDEEEALAVLKTYASGDLTGVEIVGLMGMASFTENLDSVKAEFNSLKQLFEQLKTEIGGNGLEILSMGMSGDYKIAIEEGSNLVRIGSLLFGARNYNG